MVNCNNRCMYVSPQFATTDPSQTGALIRAYPFASLISVDDDFQHKMMAGIVAFELEVTHWQCKLKLNQHRPESHQALHNVYASGNEDQRALASWMQRLGLVSNSAGEP